jgi:GR25 family glycosyltransferase involved in LPS biosynthesis
VYKTYIISLANSGSGPHLKSAKEWLPQSINSCNTHGWNAKVFSAVNGYNIKDTVWAEHGLRIPAKSKNKEKKSIGDLPGAQGCFLSHYTLWNTCITMDQPIVILEDDAIVISPMSDINLDYDLIKLHAPRATGQSKLGHWSTGAFAYWLSPVGAKKLVEFSKQNGPILADKIIVSSVLNWGYLDCPIVELGCRIGSSTQPEKYPYKFY